MSALGIDIGGSSVKIALLKTGQTIAQGRSGVYAQPNAEAVAAAIREATAAGAEGRAIETDSVSCIGLCAPGVFDPASRAITLAVNMPGLVGVNLDNLVAGALQSRDFQSRAAHSRVRKEADPAATHLLNPQSPHPPSARTNLCVFTDAHAAAVDFWAQDPLPGRLLALSLGTGVGACVLDGGAPLTVTGRSCGHLGQMDVSMGPDAPIGPDGGRGSLEAYLGVPALRVAYGAGPEGVEQILAALTVDEPPIRALVRAIRIAHAIYRPDCIVLLGGVGVRLAPLLPQIQAEVKRDLTRLARPGWRLAAGSHDWHAAAGAARLAAAAAVESGGP